MKLMILLSVLLGVIFAEEVIEQKEGGALEVDHSGETEDLLEFQSPDMTSEQ